nr:hypothetical protein [Candidatus Gracilibacteria bacterium]
MFRKKVDKSITKVDKIVTGLIIGGALASIFGATKTSLGKRILSKGISIFNRTFCFGYSLFGKSLVKVIGIFKKKK